MASQPLAEFLGGIVSTATVNNVQNYINTLFAGLAQTITVNASADLTPLTTSYQDIPSASAPVTVTGANAIGIAIATIGWGCTVLSGGSYLQGDLVVDGVSQTANGNILTPTDTTYAFLTTARAWTFTLNPGAARTIKLQARKSGAGPTGKAVAGHTALTIIVLDMP